MVINIIPQRKTVPLRYMLYYSMYSDTVGSLVFSYIYMMIADQTGEARLLEKEFGSSNLGPTGLNQAQNEVFPHFLEFGSYVFLEIEHDDSLRQYLTSIRSKIHDKNFGGPNFGQTGQNRAGN